MPRLRQLSLALALAALTAAPALGQVPTPARPDSAAAARDTLPPDTAHISARGALLRSLVLPGWGQAYVGAPGRGAIYFGLETGSLWMTLRTRRQLAAARQLQAALDTTSTGTGPEIPLARSRRQQVEDWVTLSVFFLFFSGADAYVAAQLSDFSQHVGVLPTGDGAMRVQVSVPVGTRR